METKKLTALIGIGIVILIAAGLAWAGSQGGVYISGLPLFALGIGLAFVIQWAAFIPAFIFQTEKFFDLTGSLTYTAVTVAAVLLSGNVDLRSWLLMGMVLVWAGRLGSFLVTRIHKSGKDARFDQIKPSFLRFLQTWTVQGLWVSFTLAAALAAITARVKVPLDGYAIVGFVIWLGGITIEALADRQKSVFRSEPANKDRFIQTGLWSWSRHPQLLWGDPALVWRCHCRYAGPERLAVAHDDLSALCLPAAHARQRHSPAGKTRR